MLSCLRLAPAAALTALSGCTFLATFDTVTDAGCPTCGHDSAVPSMDAPAVDAPLDVFTSADVGDCAALAEGAPCGKPGACEKVATCKSGVCTANPLPDKTACGPAPDVCHEVPVCSSGVCQPSALAPDGTLCGGGASACQGGSVCASGVCTAMGGTDGTTCGTAPDACHAAPVCADAACAAAAELPDGTTCGTATDACHTAPTCASGVCGAGAAAPDGTSWNTADPNARCCGGTGVETTTTDNCGVCGWACGTGQACALVEGEYLCTGCTADTDCISGCCSESPTPNHCSPGNCAGACTTDVCTGGSQCVEGDSIIYCSY